MIRKTYIASLFASAMALTGLGLAGLSTDIGRAGRITPRHWARVRVGGGNLQVVHARAAAGVRQEWGLTLLRGSLGALSLRVASNARWRWWAASVPVWLVVALLFVYPAVAFLRGPVRRRRRLRHNQCLECGYSLTGNMTGRCPECGTDVIAQTRPATAS